MDTVIEVIDFITFLINSVAVPFIFTLAFLVFIWGVFRYFVAGGANEEKRKEGKNFIMYGIIGFFVMLSIWGLVNILVGTFGFDSRSRPALPNFGNGSGGGNSLFPSGSNTGSNGKLPLGAVCDSDGDVLDNDCSSNECDWNGEYRNGEEKVFVCK